MKEIFAYGNTKQYSRRGKRLSKDTFHKPQTKLPDFDIAGEFETPESTNIGEIGYKDCNKSQAGYYKVPRHFVNQVIKNIPVKNRKGFRESGVETFGFDSLTGPMHKIIGALFRKLHETNYIGDSSVKLAANKLKVCEAPVLHFTAYELGRYYTFHRCSDKNGYKKLGGKYPKLALNALRALEKRCFCIILFDRDRSGNYTVIKRKEKIIKIEIKYKKVDDKIAFGENATNSTNLDRIHSIKVELNPIFVFGINDYYIKIPENLFNLLQREKAIASGFYYFFYWLLFEIRNKNYHRQNTIKIRLGNLADKIELDKSRPKRMRDIIVRSFELAKHFGFIADYRWTSIKNLNDVIEIDISCDFTDKIYGNG